MTGIEILDLIGKYAGTAVTTFVAAGAGAFVGSYLKRKGENFATHEDISKLVDQVRAVTQATKEIEATISDDVWDRQKRWELKRDTLLETAKTLAELEMALSIYILTFRPLAAGERRNTEKATEVWNDALLKVKKARLVTSLLNNGALRIAVEDLERYTVRTARECRGNPEIQHEWLQQFRQQTSAIIDLISEELESTATKPRPT